MNICVLLKQVPAKSVPIESSNGILDRTKVGGKLNPWDSYALEAALRIREALGGEITALTMGPPSAESVLREAFSLGIDHGVLLTDAAFAGADVYATAKTLASGIKTLSPFDFVICGQQSTDGDTAQLPSSLATQLSIPILGWIKSIDSITKEGILLSQEFSFGTQQVFINSPSLLSVGAGIGRVRMPGLKDKLKAKQKEIKILKLCDLEDKNPNHYGLKASPTKVFKIEEAKKTAKAEPKALTPNVAAKEILAALKKVKEGM